MGICNHKLDHYKEAADAFQKSLLIDPDNKNVQYSLLLSYYSGELLDETITQGIIYTDKYPEDPRGWQVLGLSYKQKGFSEKSEVAISKYKELYKPDDIK